MDGGSSTTEFSPVHSNIIAWLLHYIYSWTTPVLDYLGIQSFICDTFIATRKHKRERDSACKNSFKYKKQILTTRYGSQAAATTDPSYGNNPVEPDVSNDELIRLCQEYLSLLQVLNRAIL